MDARPAILERPAPAEKCIGADEAMHKAESQVKWGARCEKECEMVCDICGREGARIRRVARTYGKGEDLLVIENIPVVSCPHCGESYLTAETLHEIERLKLHRKSLAVERPVEVVSFA